MNRLKMLGLASVAAMALMAFVASSASATALYSGATKLGVGTVIESTLTGGTGTLETLEGTVLDTCTGGGVKGEITNAGGATATVSQPNTYKEGEVTKQGLTWSGCTKTTDTLNSGRLVFHWISGTINATVTWESGEVTVNTIFGSCVYGSGAATHLGTFEGGATAVWVIKAILAKLLGNIACPAEARLTASYAVTSPSPLHVTAS